MLTAEQSPVKSSKDPENPFSFPTEPRFHVGYFYSLSPHNIASHKLEDLAEENEGSIKFKTVFKTISKLPNTFLP